MRVWDIEPAHLCRQHLLGEHREVHAIWSILTKGRTGYRNHPETLRWVGKERALYLRHEDLVREMELRGYRHLSPLEQALATGSERQEDYVNTPDEQIVILRSKDCPCFLK